MAQKTTQVTVSDFRRDFGSILDSITQGDVVQILKHGKVIGIFTKGDEAPETMGNVAESIDQAAERFCRSYAEYMPDRSMSLAGAGLKHPIGPSILAAGGEISSSIEGHGESVAEAIREGLGDIAHAILSLGLTQGRSAKDS